MPDRPVFVSHSSRDAAVARELVVALEQRGVACWISGRDVPPGANYQEAIVASIRGGRAMVVLVSAAANASDEIKKELSLASAAGVAVYPVRLAEVTLNPALSYELATRQWIDGDAPQALAATLAAAIGTASANSPGPEKQPSATAALALPDKPSVVVLPFKNMSGDAEQEYFADGITEDIITELSRFRSLFVIARNSSFSYKGRTVDVRLVSQELGVRYVLEGSVRKSGDRVRVSAQLSDSATGAHLWAERYDRTLEDVFAVQEELTRGIVSAVAPEVEVAEMAQARRAVPSGDALQLTWRAQGLMTEGVRNGQAALVLEAIEIARRAIVTDPLAIAAHNVLAWAQWSCHLYRWGAAPATALYRTWQAVEQMLRISALDHRTLTICGVVRVVQGEHDRGIADLRRAVEVNPNASQSLMWLALCEAMAGASEPATVHAQLSLRLNPRDSWIGVAQLALAMARFCDGDYAAAASWADLSIQSEPAAPMRRAVMVACCAHCGDLPRAVRQLAELDAIAPGFVPSLLRGEIPVFRRAADMQHLLDGLRRAGVH